MKGFKDIVGRDELMEYIKKTVRQDTLSHAYILQGERGSGKKMLAHIFAATLQCERGGVEPCGECQSCRQLSSGNQPDVIYISHEKPSSISVEDIRNQVNDSVMIKPYSSKHKIFIIPEADIMTDQAQNALLKTLEEPPGYAVFFLLAENEERLLPTIHSRCVMLHLRSLKDSLVKSYLMEQMEIPDYQASMCTAFAQGNIGRAILLASSEHFNEIRESAVRLLQKINKMEIDEISESVKDISKYKLEVADYFDILMIWYRDVLLYKATKDVDKVIFNDQLSYIRERAEKSSYEGIEIILKSLEKAKERLRANVNFELVIELLLLTIKEN